MTSVSHLKSKLVLLCASISIVLFPGCRTTNESNSSDSKSVTSEWQDVTTDQSGIHVKCPVTGKNFCSFLDTRHNLIWSSLFTAGDKPVLLTWKQADKKCRELNSVEAKGAKLSKWRLPSRSDYESAIRNEAGNLREASMIRLGQGAPEFGYVLQFQSLWTQEADTVTSNTYWVAQRMDNHFIFTPKSSREKIPFRCVREGGGTLSASVLDGTGNPDESKTGSAKPTAEGVSKEEFSREELARSPDVPQESELRTRTVEYLRKAFSDIGLDGHLMNANGDLIIAAASGFVFSDAVVDLPREQANQLLSIIAEYMKVLDAIRTLEKRKIHVQIVGYASPSFQGAPQSGYTPEDPGARFNRVVGMQRARYIAGLVGKTKLAGSVGVETFSKGSEDPEPDPNGFNSKCGDFSCIASRKVIIRFHVE